MKKGFVVFLMLSMSSGSAVGATLSEQARAISDGWISQHRQAMIDLNRSLWENAELSFEEHQTSRILVNALRAAGFEVETGLAQMPTSFVATYGSGKPVIGLLAELDAMPGLAQDTVPYRKPIEKSAVGHGCQHNLVAASSVASALALKEVLDTLKIPGTIKVFGPPAEEVFFGKVYMIKAGLFEDVDVCLSWHSDTRTNARYNGSAAVDTVRVRFFQAPYQSAASGKTPGHPFKYFLNFEQNVEFLRDWLPSGHEISEPAITKGGGRPGLSPEAVEAWYSLRTFDRASVDALYQQFTQIGEFVSLLSGGGVDVELVNGVYPRLPLESLINIEDSNLRRYWPPKFDDAEREFARQLQEEFRKQNPGFEAPAPLHEGVLDSPIKEPKPAGNDNGDVSWVVPFGALSGGSRAMDLPSHNWQSTAAAGMGIGNKVMSMMAQAIAGTAIDLLTRPEDLRKVREEWEQKTRGFQYRPYVPDEPPVEFFEQLNKLFFHHE